MKSLLEKSRSRKNIEEVAIIASTDNNAFKELIRLMKDDTEVYLAGMAAWAASHAVEKNKLLAPIYIKDLLALVSKTHSDGIKRNIVRIWQMTKIPEKYSWEVADICFNFLKSNKESVAVKAFSITVFQHLIKDIPELKNEVMFELEKQLPHSPAAFKVRARDFFNNCN